jgi:hypothetical protein
MAFALQGADDFQGVKADSALGPSMVFDVVMRVPFKP